MESENCGNWKDLMQYSPALGCSCFVEAKDTFVANDKTDLTGTHLFGIAKIPVTPLV